MKHLLYIALILVFASSCKKKTSVVIQAQDYITGEGSTYAGREYAVSESWTPFQETKSKIVATGFLDANGKASFNLKMKNSRKYVLGVSQPDNICYGGLVQHYLDHEKNNLVDFDFLTCGSAIVPTNNINCEGAGDKMQYKYYYTDNPDIYIYRGFGNYSDWSEITFVEGCVSFPGGYNPIPVGNYTFEWRVLRQSGTTTGIDYFTVTENDTTTYILDY